MQQGAGAGVDTKYGGGDDPTGEERAPDKEEKEVEEDRGDGAHHRGADSSSAGRNSEVEATTVGLSARRETGVVRDGYADENVSVNLGGGDTVDDASVAADCDGRVESRVEGVDDDQQPRTPCSPSAYHYRSPMCSPRLSPRPTRSPYRQEGVGRRETAERGKHERSRSRGHGSELPVEVDADARGRTIAVEEAASVDDSTGACLGRSNRREELESSTGFFSQEQKQDTKKTQRPCFSGLPSVELTEGLAPRRFITPERYQIHESESDDEDFGSLGCDRVDFFFSPFESRAEPDPPWAPLPDDTVASGTVIDDSERMKRDQVFVPIEACFNGHERDSDHGAGAGHALDGNDWRQRDDSSGSSGGSDSSAGDGYAPARLPTGKMTSP